jgi:uncharacterized FlaG/YvyC family protein
MVEKIDGNISVAILARPTDRASARATEPKTAPVSAKAAVAESPRYDFEFRVNTETQEITAFIVDPVTRAVIREIPAKEMHAASDVIRNLIGPRIDTVV